MNLHLAATTAATTLLATALAAGIAWPAGAGPASTGDQFGEHVRTCAQTMGFDGVHNPGMHQGFAGWSPDHVC